MTYNANATADWGTFCRTRLWDGGLLTNNSYPQFTECFQQTVLVYVPCGWLWLTSVVHVGYVRSLLQQRRQDRVPVPESVVSILKMVVCPLLAAFVVAECITRIQGGRADGAPEALSQFLAAPLWALTFLYAAILTWISRKVLIVSPCVLFIFWILSLVSSVVGLYTAVYEEAMAERVSVLALRCVICASVCAQLALNCWAEPSLQEHRGQTSDRDLCPEVYATFPSKVVFHWINSLIYKGFKKSLSLTDVWDLPPQYKGSAIISTFQDTFNQYIKTDRERAAAPGKKSPGTRTAERRQESHDVQSLEEGIDLVSFSASPDCMQPNGTTHNGSSDPHTVSESTLTVPLFRSLFRTFFFELLSSNLIRLFGDCIQFLNPILLSGLIYYIENKEQYYAWQGCILSAGFLVVNFTQSLCQNLNFYHANNIGMKIKTALVASVYAKALVMSNEARRQFTTGSIVNLMSIDCQRLRTVTSQLWVLSSAPVQISLAFYFLHAKLGVSFLVGIGVILLLIPLNIRIALTTRNYTTKQLALKDQRLKMTSEMLAGMKVIKLSAWEESFQTKVTEIRKEEVWCLKKVALLTTITAFNWTWTPILVTTCTLLTYSFVSEARHLDPATAFVSLSLFNILKQPLNQLPTCISELVQSHVSLKRLRDFLSCEELSPDDVSHVTDEGIAISVQNGTFTWDKTRPPTLTGIDLAVKRGQLVAVVGPVGAGKSSLLSAFLGEMRKLEGSVALKGTVAYVAQQAWVQNRPLRDCVVFDNPDDPKRYRKIVKACALKPDIDMLPAKDATEIGEKGVNLSGGQKLRVTLARAVYHDADVYLLDDPLSAVDAHVGKHIFWKVVSHSGLLSKKTRVMVTHGVHWLPMCDLIVVMDNGKITQTGTYEQLLMNDGPFAQFLKTYLKQAMNDNNLQDPDIRSVLGAMRNSLENITGEIHGLPLTSDETSDTRSRTMSIVSQERLSEMTSQSNGLDQLLLNEGQKLVEDESSETGRIKAHVLKAFVRAFGMLGVVLTILFLLLYNGMGIAANVWLSGWSEDDLLRNVSLSGTWAYSQQTVLYVSVFAALGLLQGVFTFFFVGIINIKMVSASQVLHSNMLNSILHQPMGFFDTTPLGRILNRFSRDVDAVDSLMARLVRISMQQVFTVLSVLVVITYSTPWFAAVGAPVVLMYNLLQRYYMPCSRQLRRNESVSRSPVFSHFSETLNGAASIRAFGVTQRFRQQSEKLVDRNNVYFFAFIAASRWLRVRLEVLGNVIIVSAALLAAFTDHRSGSLAGLSISYALQVTMALNTLVQNSTQLESNIVSVERIVEYVDLPQEPAWKVEKTKPEIGWPKKGVISFDRFSTRYRSNMDLVLQNITCTIDCGEKVGIVGRTGAGKSSLSLSLFRLLEAAEGRILIDSVPIAAIGLHDLRSRLTILPQDPVLFSETLRFNLDPLSSYTDVAIWSAIEQANLRQFVDSQKEGLDFAVAEGGMNLSVGQRQLVCLARALLRRSRVLILDEATAAVDLETDDLIQQTIRTAFRDSTVVSIAHRINTVLDYDKIIVLDCGQIVEMDSPSRLLEDESSVFYSLAQKANLVP